MGAFDQLLCWPVAAFFHRFVWQRRQVQSETNDGHLSSFIYLGLVQGAETAANHTAHLTITLPANHAKPFLWIYRFETFKGYSVISTLCVMGLYIYN